MSSRDGNVEIYVMNADGSNVTRLTDDREGNYSPAWSPDGSRIAFLSDRDSSFEMHNSNIYVMNADGSGLTRLTSDLTSDPASDGAPAWSPDGSRIAFVSNRDQNRGRGDIYLTNADGSGLTRLTDTFAGEGDPAWSPDGSRIAFTYGAGGIDVMNADGSNVTRLTDNPALYVDQPAWSPDGSRIAITNGAGGIDVINAGSGVTHHNITEGGAPAWSPDGSRIAFFSNRDGNGEIYVMNADGSGQTRLTDSPASDYAPAWSPTP